MSLFSSHKEASKESSPEIPANFFSVVRTMQDDIDGKPLERPSVVHAENTTANPFSPEFHPSEGAAQAPITSQPPVSQGPFADTQVGSQSPSAPRPTGITLDAPAKKTLPARTRKILIGTGIVMGALLLLGVLAYFLLFWNQSTPQTMPQEEPVSITELPAEEPAESVVQTPPFAADQPNYLSIDVEIATPESIRTMLDEASARIIVAGMTAPVEFLITDKNNNPIAFSRFAFVSKIDFSSDLLALIDEPFSMFVFNNAGTASLGLSLSFKDVSLAADRLTKEEESIPYELKSFLYGGVATVAQKSTFHSGTYASQAVRFVNIDADKNISCDYMVRDKQWIIGSSKETLRAIADRVQE